MDLAGRMVNRVWKPAKNLKSKVNRDIKSRKPKLAMWITNQVWKTYHRTGKLWKT